MSNPETNTGLVNAPRLLQIRGKILLFWAGTSTVVKQPELYFASRGNGDSSWAPSKPPFYGRDMSRVRALAVATARDMMAVIFEREGGQDGAMEILLSTSADFGYSFSKPFILDSFVLGESSGSYVTLAARQGVKRPEFAAAWVAEAGSLRVTSIDTRSGERPVAVSVGIVPDIKSHAEMLSAGGDGFYAIWPEAGSGLRTVHITALQGEIEKPISLAPGNFGRNFSTCYNFRGPGVVVGTTESGGDLHSYVTKDQRFVALHPTQKDPVSGRGLSSRTCFDEDKNVHRVTLDPSGNHLIYTLLKDGKWSTPEPICDLRPDIDVTGIDIVAADGYAWVVAGQGQILTIKRHRIK